MSEKLETSMLLKFIKPSNGSRDKLCSFINNCDNAFKLASQSQKPLLLNYILCQLESKAETVASIKDFESWEQLSQFLQSQFGERKHYAHLLLDLQESQQLPNESVSQYSLGVESSLYKLLTEITLANKKKVELSGKISAMEELALHCFIMGLTPRISNFVRMKNPRSLNEATNHAGMREGRPIHNLNKQPAPICRYCKFPGHVIENCKKREYNNNRSRNNFNRASASSSNNNFQRPATSRTTQYPHQNRVHHLADDERGQDETDGYLNE
ncbi:unnamed protein product [Pieris brassicae]|uniref:Retrotransposon gag domain-containing protein n=1 Tax=Pieris brassicae TaxID=7116 RepID=A0A9P0TJP4_PIEBR|nr:unnamed protein product [Pieris brassicae]